LSTLVEKNEEILQPKLASINDFFVLMKPRVMSLVIFTTLIGYFCGLFSSQTLLNPFLSLIGIFAVALGAGSSGVLNQWYDRDIDAKMERTKNRPIPIGKIEPSDAFAFGLVGSILSVVILGLSINWIGGFLLFFTIVFYAIFYTIFLKRYTCQNIVIGGASGALPPVLGYVCATGTIGLESMILFGIIFLWTPPHFWALSLKTKLEYKLVNIPMLPNVRGDLSTKRHILIYTFILVFFSTFPYFLNFNSVFYLIFSVLLGLKFIYEALNLLRIVNYNEKKLFNFSIIYLFLIFLFIFFDKIIVSYVI